MRSTRRRSRPAASGRVGLRGGDAAARARRTASARSRGSTMRSGRGPADHRRRSTRPGTRCAPTARSARCSSATRRSSPRCPSASARRAPRRASPASAPRRSGRPDRVARPHLDVQVAQLLLGDRRRARRPADPARAASSGTRSRRGSDSTPAIIATMPVEAERDAAVRRRAVRQRVEQEAELLALVLGADPQRARTPSPARRAGGCAPSRRRSPSRSARRRRPWRSRCPGSVAKQLLVAVLRRGERMVARGPGLRRRRRTRTSGSRRPTAASSPLSARPRSWPTFARSAPSASLTTFSRSAPKKMRSPVLRAGALEDRRAAPPAGRNLTIGDCRPSSFGFAASLTLMYARPFDAVDLDERRVVVDLLARQRAAAGHAQRGDAPVRQVGGGAEHLEVDRAS